MSIEEVDKLLPLAQRLFKRVQGHFLPEDFDLLKRACVFAEEHFSNIVHPTTWPYNEYILQVAALLFNLGADSVVVSAAINLPPPPIAGNVIDDIKKHFQDQKELVNLVEEVLHLNNLEWDIWSISSKETEYMKRKEILREMFLLAIGEVGGEGQVQNLQMAVHFQKQEKQIENLIRMYLTAITDIRAIIIKLADRLHTIRLLKSLSQIQKEIFQYALFAKITLAVYAPLADQLGMWGLKSELEDMAFRLLDPINYKFISAQLLVKKQERLNYIGNIITFIRKELEEFGIKATISGRPKHVYSIYQKMEAKQLIFEQINDLLGIRIIVDTIEDCYSAEAIIHEFWQPITEFYGGRAGRDWIAHPKANQYQSLHTTIHFDSTIVEVQIRTHQMHEIAEYGASATHWRYKESKIYGKGKTPRVIKTKDQVWNKLLTELRKHLASTLDSASPTQRGFSKYWTFVITPIGHVIDLPTGATPLDFAYRIHTDLGHRYSGAKVNGRVVRLDYTLKNGDVVELFTSRTRKSPSIEWLSKNRVDEERKSDNVVELFTSRTQKGPGIEWLSRRGYDYSYYVFARTRQARSKIRRWLNQQNPRT